MVSFTKKAFESIKGHALHEAPKEACGVLAGAQKKVTEVFPCTNVDKNPYSAYTVDPQELLKIMDEIEKDSSKSLEIIGFYHSHPFTGSRPSAVDISRAAWDEYLYAIYSIPEDMLRCWRWSEEQKRFFQETIKFL